MHFGIVRFRLIPFVSDDVCWFLLLGFIVLCVSRGLVGLGWLKVVVSFDTPSIFMDPHRASQAKEEKLVRILIVKDGASIIYWYGTTFL